MKREFQNLLDREEWLVLNLKNAKHLTNLYLQELPQFLNDDDQEIFSSKAKWYSDVFTYYNEELIPAIQEQAEMERRHLLIFDNNPDEGYHPEFGVQDHQKMADQFLLRFAQVHKEFAEFISTVKAYRNTRSK